jgi:hypothetical protein
MRFAETMMRNGQVTAELLLVLRAAEERVERYSTLTPGFLPDAKKRPSGG